MTVAAVCLALGLVATMLSCLVHLVDAWESRQAATQTGTDREGALVTLACQQVRGVLLDKSDLVDSFVMTFRGSPPVEIRDNGDRFFTVDLTDAPSTSGP